MLTKRMTLAPVAAAAAALLLLGLGAAPAHALSRRAADRAALKALRPRSEKGPVVLYGLPRPLRARSVVAEAGPGPRALRHAKHIAYRGEAALRTKLSAVRLRRAAWLYWEDLAPRALFMHPSVLLLIDGRSGRVVAKRSLFWWPIVNGRRPAFLKTASAWTKPRYRVFSTLEASGPLAHVALLEPNTGWASAALAHAAATSGPPPLPNDCVVVLADHSDPIFKGDLDAISTMVKELHLRRFDSTGANDLDSVITAAEKSKPACKDIAIFIAAHGWAAKGSNYPHPHGGGNIPESDHAQVTLKNVVANGAVTSETLDAGQLRKILARHAKARGTTFKLIADACFSARWEELRDVPGLLVILTSARRDQMGFGYFQAGGNYHKATQASAIVTQSPQRLVNTTVNPSRAGGFTNGVVLALDRWAHSEQAQQDTGGSFAKALVYQFAQNQQTFNYGYQAGWAIPQIVDNTANGPAPPGNGPTAAFGFSPNSPPHAPKAGQLVTFDASASSADVEEYHWTFDDGWTLTGRIVAHAFAHPGVYQAHLRVVDGRGVEDVRTALVYVSAPGTKPAPANDLPCDGSASSGFVDINIPSYAENAIAALTADPSYAGVTITNLQVVRHPGQGAGFDEWGRPKDQLHVTFTITGGTTGAGSGSYTITASWQ